MRIHPREFLDMDFSGSTKRFALHRVKRVFY